MESEFPSWLDTGDNEKLQEELTDKVLKDLYGWGYTPKHAIADRVGIFCHVYLAPDHSRVFILVKGSAIWKDLVSCQAFLPQRAVDEKASLLIAMLRDPTAEAEYFLFNPEEIVSKNEGYNDRLGVRFVNFSVALGERFYPNKQSVRRQLERLKKRGFQATF